MRVRLPAARCARVVHELFAQKSRGRGECRVPAAPAASRAMCRKHTSVVTTVAPEHPAFPHAMVLTAYFVLSPVIGLVCHRHPRIWHACARSGRHASAGLDAGVEASGPHDFAVRELHLSSARRSIAHRSMRTRPAITHAPNAAASTASHPASVTIAIRPSVGRDDEASKSDLGQAGTGIFFELHIDEALV